jgi:hypothetical protein
MLVADRFEAIGDGSSESRCFLCLKVSSDFCQECGLAFCCEGHRKVHGGPNYCYPFRVLQKPGVRISETFLI